jgi:hypothetical protein
MMQQQQPQQHTTLAEKVETTAALALFPAMTIMVFLRRKLGYRFLDPMKILGMALVLWVLSAFSAVSGNIASALPLTLFAVIFLIVGYAQRRTRWWDIRYGVSWHSYSRGISWFSYIPFWPLSETSVKRFIDPAAAAIVGVILAFIFPWLGYYIVFSAVCLFIFEAADYERSINRMLDQLDNLVESEVVSGNVAYYAGEGQAAQRPLEETAGIPTGTDPDLAAAIERRKVHQGRGTGQAALQLPATPVPQFPPAPPRLQGQPDPSQSAPPSGFPDNLAF